MHPDPLYRVAYGIKTDIGVARDENEDSFDIVVPTDGKVLSSRGCLFVVADGMGGHAAGAVASNHAVNALTAEYYRPAHSDAQAALRAGFDRANREVLLASGGNPERSGMGCTLVAVAVSDELTVANVGDSRCYVCANGSLEQITEDHSVVEAQVRAGLLSPEAARESPFRNAVTRCVGSQEWAGPDVLTRPIAPGDMVLLCTDGLCDVLSDEGVAQLIHENPAPTLAARALVGAAIEAGSRDNVTALCVSIEAASA